MLFSFVESEGEEAKATEKEEDVKVDEEKLTYAKGSLCGYCDYCEVNILLSLINCCEISVVFCSNIGSMVRCPVNYNILHNDNTQKP